MKQILKQINDALFEIDPMPWHQAVVLGVLICVMLVMACL